MSHNQLISSYYQVLRSVFTGLENMEDKAENGNLLHFFPTQGNISEHRCSRMT